MSGSSITAQSVDVPHGSSVSHCFFFFFSFSFLKFIPLTKSLCGSLGDSIRHYGSRRKTVTMPSQLWPQVENHFVFNISGDILVSRCF